MVRRLGWVSRAAAGDFQPSTSSIAWQILTLNNESTKELIRKERLTAEERDETLAQEALAWGRSQPTTGVSDYLYNLGVACRMPWVTSKTLVLVASVIAAYQRHVDKEAELKVEVKVERKHVGTVGKRSDFPSVTVKRLRYFESDYGVRTLVTFEDTEGNILIWWASKELDEIQEGDTVNIRGTVKAHGDYKGILQTELKRVNFLA